jgi:hypothetical protein
MMRFSAAVIGVLVGLAFSYPLIASMVSMVNTAVPYLMPSLSR